MTIKDIDPDSGERVIRRTLAKNQELNECILCDRKDLKSRSMFIWIKTNLGATGTKTKQKNQKNKNHTRAKFLWTVAQQQ